jgi:hypothetical protein
MGPNDISSPIRGTSFGIDAGGTGGEKTRLIR